MTNELNELMDRDPLQLSAQDIDKIIEYQRKQRAIYEAGGKPSKAGQEPKKIDLAKIGLAKPVEKLRRI